MRLQRCAIATRVGERLGQVGELRGHLGLRREVLLGREAPRPPRVGEDVAFGDAHARLVRAEVVARAGTARVRGDDRQRELARERDGGGDQRVVVGMPGALHFEVVALRKPRRPFARRARRAGGVALQQRVADVAVARAGQRDQAVGAFGEPLAPQLGAAAMLVGAVGAREPVAQLEVAVARSRRAGSRETAGRARASCVIHTSQPAMGLMPAPRAACRT